HHQRVIEFQAGAKNGRLLPVAVMRNQRIIKGEAFAELQSQVRRDARLIASEERISGNPGRTQKRKHQSLGGYVVPGNPVVNERDASSAVTPIHPVLRRKLLRHGTLNGPEGDLVESSPIFDGSREEHAIPHELIIIENLSSDIDSANSRVHSDPRLEGSRAEGMGDVEFGEDRAGR